LSINNKKKPAKIHFRSNRPHIIVLLNFRFFVFLGNKDIVHKQ